MKQLFLFIIFTSFAKTMFAQNGHQRLIVAEFRVDKPKEGNFAYLVTYNFEKGFLNLKTPSWSRDFPKRQKWFLHTVRTF